ncbi:uncharacterized protein B0T15DRAFT_531241 [Chaetomium strumarium]|uniref:Secreted protein n=1 Tax=Chaetomium strumarium TaxID=1170767 RepID=A0AAJ0M121_9PEZI|nr:hypothetical protein B0T15DRAFT_531241 [Chaetomium strumarium]
MWSLFQGLKGRLIILSLCTRNLGAESRDLGSGIRNPNLGSLTACKMLEGSGCKKHSLYKQPRKRDRSGENFRKRWQTLAKTGYALHQAYGARIYFSISIPRTRRDFVFRSERDVVPI